MTDSQLQPNIVDRLRDEAKRDDHRGAGLILRQAADEIERLERGIGGVAFAMGWTNLKGMTVEEYAASLRAALESIEQYGSDTLSGRADGPDDREWQREGVREMRDRARAALGQPK